MDLGQSIAELAKTYIGKKEIPPNAGFEDKQMQADMLNANVAWYIGANWCAFFCILIWWKCLSAASWAYFSKFKSGNAQDMFRQCHASKYIITGQIPKVGAIAVYQEGDNETIGHADLVTSVIDDQHYTTLDGNSNQDGSRNGYEVAPHTKTVGLPHNPTGLNLVGFIYPLELTTNI